MTDSQTQGLIDWLGALRRRWLLIAVVTLVVPAVALVVSLSQEKQYTATASVLIQQSGVARELLGIDTSGDAVRSIATDVSVLESREFASRVSAHLNNEVSLSDVAGAVEIVAPGTSDYVEIEATHSDPEVAALIANTMADIYVAYRRDSLDSAVLSARDTVNDRLGGLSPRLTRGRYANRLRGRLGEIELVAAVQKGSASVISTAEPPGSPSSPRTKRNVAVGFVIGLMLGVALALALELVARNRTRP